MQNNETPENKKPEETPSEKTIIQCRKIFGHRVEDVFAAFLDAPMLKQWFGPQNSQTGSVHVDARIGGNYAIELQMGEKSLWIKGSYTTIIPNQQLDFTFFYEPDMPGIGKSDVRIVFSPQDETTEIVLTQIIYKAINPEGRTKGWESGFDKLDTLLCS